MTTRAEFDPTAQVVRAGGVAVPVDVYFNMHTYVGSGDFLHFEDEQLHCVERIKLLVPAYSDSEAQAVCQVIREDFHDPSNTY